MAESKLEIMDFWAPWCGPCHMMEPILAEAEKTYGDKGLVITKINVDEQPELANAHQVLSIPTYFYKKDGKIVDQAIGAQAKDQFFKKIEEYLG